MDKIMLHNFEGGRFILPIQINLLQNPCQFIHTVLIRERCKKKKEKKVTSVSFMYVCVAGNGEMLVFFLLFSPTIV